MSLTGSRSNTGNGKFYVPVFFYNKNIPQNSKYRYFPSVVTEASQQFLQASGRQPETDCSE